MASGRCFFALLFAMGFIATTGCNDVQLSVARIKPAPISLVGVSRVAIAAVDGEGGDDVADLIAHSLMQSGRFDVLDRHDVDGLLAEHYLGRLDGEVAAQWGSGPGADALIYGRMIHNEIREEYDVTENVCAGAICATYQRDVSVTLAVHLNVVEVRSGRLLGSVRLDASRVLPRQTRLRYAPADENIRFMAALFDRVESDAMRDRAYAEIADKFSKTLAPHYETETVFICVDKRLPMAMEGLTAAQRADWPAAIHAFRHVVSFADTNARRLGAKLQSRAHYDLGVMLGYSGQYDEGVLELIRAHQLYREPAYAKEIDRVKQFARDDSLAQAQRESAPPHGVTSVGASAR